VEWKAARCRALDVVQRIDLGAEEMVVRVDLSRMLGKEVTVVRYVIPARIRRRGIEMRLVLHDGEKASNDARVDPALVKAIIRGKQWFEQLASGRAKSFAEIARRAGVTSRYVAHLIPLAFLAPDIVVRILSGTQPVELTTEDLTKRIDLPPDWTEQRALLGLS
jgi:site-specific DNA recombinase